MFQDIYGRTATIKIDPVFSDLLTAFDSSTSSEEEKERERQRNIGEIEYPEEQEEQTEYVS